MFQKYTTAAVTLTASCCFFHLFSWKYNVHSWLSQARILRNVATLHCHFSIKKGPLFIISSIVRSYFQIKELSFGQCNKLVRPMWTCKKFAWEIFHTHLKICKHDSCHRLNVVRCVERLGDPSPPPLEFVTVTDLELYIVQSHLRKPSPVIAYSHTLPHRSPSDPALKLECGAEWDFEEATTGTVAILAWNIYVREGHNSHALICQLGFQLQANAGPS